MDLYILRHAKAVPRTGRTAARDPERKLTAEGEKRAHEVALGMLNLGLSFDLVLTSPYERSRRTAQIVCEVMKRASAFTLTPHLAPDGDPQALIRDINHRKRQLDHLLLVGHEPYLSEFVSTLVAGSPDARLNFKKAGLCLVTTDALRLGQCATLEWLLTPRQLVRLSKL